MSTQKSPTDAQPELEITRVFDVPRSLMFKVWTDPEHLMRWGAPRGMTTPFHEADVRPGGTFRVCMRSTEGEDYWLRGTYREITEPERLVFTHSWDDDDGKPGHETLVTVTFQDDDGKTKLTLRQSSFQSDASRDGHVEGWNSQLDRLGEYIAELT